jgi:hypothetical protein
MVPIPIFDGTRPYQHVPFQYSLHCLENEDAELVHYEYLGAPRMDPREGLIENLVIEVPEDACILVYNQSFETRVLNSLKDWFPECADRIDGMIMGLRDLMVLFRNRDFYHWKMEGSYSLKYVLPVLLPELSYDELELSNGEMASNAYLRMWGTHDLDEIEDLRQALLEYCRLDTLGMVEILRELKDLISP